MSFKLFMKELNGQRIEGELIKTGLYSLLASIVLFTILYFLKLNTIENFIPKYGFYIFFSAISYSLLIPAIRQVKAYGEFACMSGMMIGMTMGMMAGFLSGYYIGATNGMFTGSIFGVAFGIFVGIWTGKSCGIMGFMEGMMAGLMGGLMGAMTSVMLLNDHLILATIIISIVCWAIIISLNYMVFREMKDAEIKIKTTHGITLFLAFVFMVLTIAVMILGPRSVLLQ